MRHPKNILAKMHQIALNNSIEFVFKEECKAKEMASGDKTSKRGTPFGKEQDKGIVKE